MAKNRRRLPEVRISYLWLQPFASRLPAAIVAYRQLAHCLLAEKRHPRWCLPWQDPDSSRSTSLAAADPFWLSYCGRDRLEPIIESEIDAEMALGCLLPLRYAPPKTVSVAVEGFELAWWVERFFLPVGAATVLTLRLRRPNPGWGNAALWEIADLACRIRPRLREAGSEPRLAGENQVPVELEPFPLARLEQETGRLGSLSAPRQPAILTTVIQSSPPDLTDPPNMAKALHGFCTRNALWRGSPVGPEKGGQTHQAAHSNFATWLPPAYEPARQTRSLSSYHRHQTFVGLQVRAAILALSKIDFLMRPRLDGEGPDTWTHRWRHWNPWRRFWSIDQDELAFRLDHQPWLMAVAGLLGRLYGGEPTAYRTWTTHSFIQRGEAAGLINSVRERFAKPPVFSRLDEIPAPAPVAAPPATEVAAGTE